MLRMESLSARGSNTAVTSFHKKSARIPSNLRPASSEIISASVLLGTSVWLPKMHKILPDVDVGVSDAECPST